MKYVFIGLGVLLLVFLMWLFFFLKKRRAEKCVKRRCHCEKIKDLNQALNPFGYVYDEKQDYFTSGKYTWQREMGYCRFYDENAPAFSMLFDCEPIVFDYDGRKWLIEFWKGQYGMSSGAEIGVYTAKEEIDIPGVFTGTFYESVNDDEMLPMSFTLKKKGRVLCKRAEVHWWLTAFILGEFSRPCQLTMDINICFPNCCMQNSFLRALMELGYKKEEICVCGLNVSICFTSPKSCQPHRKCKFLIWLSQQKNKRKCRIYQRLTNCYFTTLDKVDYIGCRYPKIYKLLICAGRLSTYNRKLRKFKHREDK